MKLALCFLITSLYFLIQGCTSIYQPPPPWEREILAQEKMSVGGDLVASSVDEHVYFSKEAASISRNIGGGGCGCN